YPGRASAAAVFRARHSGAATVFRARHSPAAGVFRGRYKATRARGGLAWVARDKAQESPIRASIVPAGFSFTKCPPDRPKNFFGRFPAGLFQAIDADVPIAYPIGNAGGNPRRSLDGG
ncbi:hypothetical protein EB077_13460, partial [bacterium]|nr:hypothetical protein [bacterium]